MLDIHFEYIKIVIPVSLDLVVIIPRTALDFKLNPPSRSY